MPTNIIIDGYNLIRHSPDLQALDALDLEAARDALAERLTRYKRMRGHKITVVYDGLEGRSLAETKGRARGIRVIYSRRGERADDVIRRLTSKRAAGTIVVTSDRELGRAVEAAGATVIDSPEFEARLIQADLYAAKGMDADSEEEEETASGRAGTKKKGPSKRPSKKERRKSRRLDRL